MQILEKPSNELVAKYIAQFDCDIRYKTADHAILKLFKAFPSNDDLGNVLLKISVLNDMYSTNILGTFKMAEHVYALKLDNELKKGLPEVVHKIAKGHGIKNRKTNKELNFYSFATKYCSWHNLEEYAIYDSFVEKVLMAYKKQDNFSNFKKDELKDFRKFKEVIYQFSGFYGLTNHSLKNIDKFLWYFGKEKFPTSY